MSFIKNTLARQLSISDKDGVIFINPSETVEIDTARLKTLKKRKVIKSYFSEGFLISADSPSKNVETNTIEDVVDKLIDG